VPSFGPRTRSTHFIKPDGARIAMDVEGDIPHLTGVNGDTACPAADTDGPDTDNDDPDMVDMPRGPITGRCVWNKWTRAVPPSVVRNDARSQEDNVVRDDVEDDDDATPRREEPPDIIGEDEVEEIESLPTGVVPPDDGDADPELPRDRSDLDAGCSGDFLDSPQEALAVRHLATHKPKLKSCDACRRAEALRAKLSRKHKTGFARREDPYPETLVINSRWIISLPEMCETKVTGGRLARSRSWTEPLASVGGKAFGRKLPQPTWR
jgi:hypothetical protein